MCGRKVLQFSCISLVAACVAVGRSESPQQQAAEGKNASAYAALVAQAKADLNSGNAAKALVEAQQAEKLDPKPWKAFLIAGAAHESQKQYSDATTDFADALLNAPEDKKTAIHDLFEKSKKEESASGASAAQPAVPATPRAADAPIVIKDPAEYSAYSNFATQRFPKDKAVWGEQFLVQYPQSVARAQVLLLLIDAYKRLQDAGHALSAANRLLQIDPNDAKALSIVKSQTATVSISGNAGPSLAETMQFIVEKLENQGILYYDIKPTDAQGTERGWFTGASYATQYTEVNADATTCSFSFAEADSSNNTKSYFLGSFKDIKAISVESSNTFMRDSHTAATPPLFVLTIKAEDAVFRGRQASMAPQFIADKKGRQSNNPDYRPPYDYPASPTLSFDFRDEDMANRVARAMKHAAELCGAGNKTEPF